MIASIGILIGGYIILRCFEILARPDSAFSCKRNKIAVHVLSVIVLLASVIITADIITAGSDVAAAFRTMMDPKMR